MWVIFGHMYSVRIQNIVNALTVTNEVETPFYLLVLASFFAVDVFFYIGGFLVAYSFLRNSMKSIGPLTSTNILLSSGLGSMRRIPT